MYFAEQKKQSLHEKLGGDEGIRILVKEFYDIIEQDEDARALHLLHLQGQGSPIRGPSSSTIFAVSSAARNIM